MYCPDCGTDNLWIDLEKYSVLCLRCLFNPKKYVSYLNRFQDEDLFFFSDHESWSAFWVENKKLLKKIADGTFNTYSDKVLISLSSKEPSKLEPAISLLRRAFGHLGEIIVFQIGVDKEIDHCPLCLGNQFTRISSTIICAKCGGFSLSIPDMAASLLEKAGFTCNVGNNRGSMPRKFYVSYGELPHWYKSESDLTDDDKIAQIEVRVLEGKATGAVVTVRPMHIMSDQQRDYILEALEPIGEIDDLWVVRLQK